MFTSLVRTYRGFPQVPRINLDNTLGETSFLNLNHATPTLKFVRHHKQTVYTYRKTVKTSSKPSVQTQAFHLPKGVVCCKHLAPPRLALPPRRAASLPAPAMTGRNLAGPLATPHGAPRLSVQPRAGNTSRLCVPRAAHTIRIGVGQASHLFAFNTNMIGIRQDGVAVNTASTRSTINWTPCTKRSTHIYGYLTTRIGAHVGF